VRWSRLVSGGRWSLLTPSGLVVRAVVGILVFTILHAIGLRAYTTVISGTSPTGRQVGYGDMWKMLAYVLSYLSATVLAPILLLAAGVLSLLTRRVHRPERYPGT